MMKMRRSSASADLSIKEPTEICDPLGPETETSFGYREEGERLKKGGKRRAKYGKSTVIYDLLMCHVVIILFT